MIVDLAFGLTGLQPIPADHGYALYAAVSRCLPVVHQQEGIGIHPIAGRQVGNRQLALQPWSRLTVRVSDEKIAAILPLAGRSLDVGGATLRVGVPEVRVLRPATALRSRLVTIKIAGANAKDIDEQGFAGSARKQLSGLGVSSDARLTIGKRRTARIKRQGIVGYEALVEGLLAEESIKLQEAGVGGRRLMGCGVFVPYERQGAPL